MRLVLTRALPAAAIITAAAIGGFCAYGLVVKSSFLYRAAASAPATRAPQAPPAVVSGSATPTAAASSDSTMPAQVIPDALPDVPFTDSPGVTRRFSDWKGHPLLVNFWAAWCQPCREEIPLLEALSRQRARQGLRVIGVAVDSRAAVLDYARQAAIRYPLLIGEQPGLELVKALGMEAVFPFSVFVDARGRIVTLKIGKLRADQAALILDRVDDLDHGRIDLSAARAEISAGMAKLALTRSQGAARGGL